MPYYSVTFVLHEDQNYERLFEELELLNAVKVSDSTWCFESSTSGTSDIRMVFEAITGGNDSLIVTKVTDPASIKTLGLSRELG